MIPMSRRGAEGRPSPANSRPRRGLEGLKINQCPSVCPQCFARGQWDGQMFDWTDTHAGQVVHCMKCAYRFVEIYQRVGWCEAGRDETDFPLLPTA